MPDIKDLVTNLGSTIILERPPLRPPPNFRRTVMIDFENVASGTAVDTVYSAQSVSFASVTTNPPKRWSAYAMAMNLGAAQSGKNVLTLTNATGLPLFDARYGAVEATFSQLQQSVSVWAYALDSPECLGGNYDNRPFMEAYDANGTYLGKARTQLGWRAEVGLPELVAMMVREDIQQAQRDVLCTRNGFAVNMPRE